MGSTTTTELGLDFTPSSLVAITTLNAFLRKVGEIDDLDLKVAKIEEYLRCLQEERRKIEAFKRELPLSMLILADVIEVLKEEVVQCRGDVADASARPVLEQFLPIRSKSEEDGVVKPEKDSKDKMMKWMSSAQLWSDNYSDCNTDANSNSSGSKRKSMDERNGEADRQSESGNPLAERKSKSGCGAFIPFKGDVYGVPAEEKKTPAAALPDLCLLTPGFRNSCGSSSHNKTAAQSQQQQQQQQQQQGPRKARRCWSPELHRRFLTALQQLGGSQATPKQIRELMKVDGLTNDEVKSHLQKYRLHTRRIGPASSPGDQSMVVLGGGLWVQSATDHYPLSKPSCNSQSGSPQGPLQLTGAAACGISTTGGDSCEEEEEEEEGRSESYSWKGHSLRSAGE